MDRIITCFMNMNHQEKTVKLTKKQSTLQEELDRESACIEQCNNIPGVIVVGLTYHCEC